MLIEPMLQRLRAAPDLRGQLKVALADVIALHGAERGNLQLLDTEDRLVIIEHQGFDARFIAAVGRLALHSGSVCSRAASQVRTVFVPDTETDAEFKPLREIARDASFRSVISAPIVAPGGQCVGVVSVHFSNRFAPSTLELQSLTSYCRALGEEITRSTPAADLRAIASGTLPH